MRLGTICILLALAWTAATPAQPPTTAIHPLSLVAKATQPAPDRQGRGFTDVDVVRIAGFDPGTHVLAVAGSAETMKVVVWDKRQSRTAPGSMAAEIGSLSLGGAPVVGGPRNLALVTAALAVNTSSGNGSIVLDSSGVARVTKNGAGRLSLAPAAGDNGSQGTYELCRGTQACASGYLTTVNVSVDFARRIGYVENPVLDSDGDGVTDDVDQCPDAGDQGYGLDGNGCPIVGPQDSDGDGVLDENDACPGQSDVGYGVDANGCPNVDSDFDGVFDAVDQCPDRGEEGYGVSPEGCPNPPAPQDYDGDGVTDDVDQCFAEGDTYGYGVDPNGCPIMDSDGDGYADPYDACPNDGDQGSGVDTGGCPVAP